MQVSQRQKFFPGTHRRTTAVKTTFCFFWFEAWNVFFCVEQLLFLRAETKIPTEHRTPKSNEKGQVNIKKAGPRDQLLFLLHLNWITVILWVFLLFDGLKVAHGFRNRFDKVRRTMKIKSTDQPGHSNLAHFALQLKLANVFRPEHWVFKTIPKGHFSSTDLLCHA